jgi:Family of unknown function (DUF6184)
MTTSLKLGVFVGLVGAVTVAGCTKVSEPAPRAAVESNPALTPASRARTAPEQLAEARCEREQQCGNIGNDRTYASSSECFARIRNEWREDLNGRECPGGINQGELQNCLAQIRGEACQNPFDTLARLTACTAGRICVEQR